MFTVSVETHFWASHQLTLPARRRRVGSEPALPASKKPLHWHNWAVTADVSSEKLDSMGLVMDFHRLKAMVDNIIAGFDNIQLDSIDYFQRSNSSAENVAKYIYERLEPKLPKGLRLNHVKVIEEPGCSAKFSKPRVDIFAF